MALIGPYLIPLTVLDPTPIMPVQALDRHSNDEDPHRPYYRPLEAPVTQSPHGINFEAHRPVVMGRNGMVCAGQPLASQAGIAMLQKGRQCGGRRHRYRRRPQRG